MLSGESLEIARRIGKALADRFGEAEAKSRFRSFDTICSATQERQDAVHDMLDAGGLDLMIVIGGYNSSNTLALARMCAPRVKTFYIDSPSCVEGSGIRHRKIGATEEMATDAWLPEGDVRIGVTAGASTPDSVVGETIERILALRGRTAEDLTQTAHIAQGSQSYA